ncbi:hypothetical protein ACIPQA_18815 [Streptomyces sp. NPDC090109]|uniref:hypothetical protein n=1 Tax=unclassified Streptomyces TaxID=2593676 RepID=UPI001F0A9592|nr:MULTISPECIES: hypothetical protein [unclassified Streptomyces]
MALVSAVATLLAALFFCLGTGPEAGPGSHHGAAPEQEARAAAAAVPVEYVCPYDRGGCSLFPSLSPAVLGAPPLDPPLQAADGLPRLAPVSGDGPARRSGVRPRAPDLHVLQVLRT